MRRSMFAIPLLFLASLSPAVMKASDITYNVNATVGAAGSLTGFITTDGDLGVLGQADILGWNLNLNDGINSPVDLIGPSGYSALQLGGADLTATANTLFFNYSATDEGVIYFGGGGGLVDACYTSVYTYCAPYKTDSTISVNTQHGGVDAVYTSMSGVQPIANVATSPTPEPGSLILLGSGLLGLAGLSWRRFAYQGMRSLATGL